MAKNARKLKDKNAPKKPLSTYMFFANETRQRSEDIKGMMVTEQAKVIGARWKELGKEDKEPYEKMAKEDKERYEKQMEEYRKSPEYEMFMEMSEKQKKAKRARGLQEEGK
ncbi:hypothetical protein NUSPORA_02805 [Nucleospora cyclopteri]